LSTIRAVKSVGSSATGPVIRRASVMDSFVEYSTTIRAARLHFAQITA
jgi:hypothetical protein